MSRWRLAVVAVLILLPYLCLAGFGTWYLWTSGLGRWLWFGLIAVLSAGHLLAWYWQRNRTLLRPPEFEPSPAWTERDQRAWALVEARAQAAPRIDPQRLQEFDFYVAQAKEMAQELARFYHPGSRDPIGPLTVPEILAAIELASHDLSEMVEKYLPGGHMLTVNDLRLAQQATGWYSTAMNAYWLIAAVFDPVRTGMRYLASRYGVSQPWKKLQENLLLWFYTAFVQRTGMYLVELNSGRLRVGVARYRQLVRGEAAAAGAEPVPVEGVPAAPPPDPPRKVVITLVGQVKAGKSSLVNAMLGERKAIVDVLPATDEITRYHVKPAGLDAELEILDTVGYGHAGPRADQLKATRHAAQGSDLLLLVLHATNPARQADRLLLEDLRTWFAARPHLRRPPILAVLTHIDLLSPSLEWAPPYDWRNPTRKKEQQIAQAVTAVRETLGEFVVGIAPVCVAEGKVFGVEESLLPAVASLLGEARSVALLRLLRAEYDATRARKVFQQLIEVGKIAGKALWQSWNQP